MLQINIVIELIRVVIVLFLIFVFIPQLFLGIKLRRLDSVFISVTFTSFFMVIAAHIFALAKLMDIFAYFLIFTVFVFLFLRVDIQGKSLLGKMLPKLIYMIDLFDLKKEDLLKKISFRTKFKKTLLTQLKKIIRDPYISASTFFVFCASFIVRIKYSLLHAAYPHIDMYLHLKWIKGIMSNDLFYNNEIYPKGMHAIYATVAKLTFIDPYMLVRFMGPIVGTILVLSVYNLAYKLTDNRYTALLAMTVYGLTDFGLTNLGLFPSQMFRQSATMSQELGMLFVMLGLAFIIDYIKQKEKIYLFAFYACIFLVFMIHSYAAMYLVMWSGVFILISLIKKELTVKEVFSLATLCFLIILLTFVPLLIGRLFGADYHRSSIEMITDVSKYSVTLLMVGQFIKAVFLPKDPYMYSVILGVLLIPLVQISPTRRYIHYKKNFFISIALSSLATYLLFNIPSLLSNINIPLLFEKDRTGPFLCLLVPILVAQILDYISNLVLTLKKIKGELARVYINNTLTTVSLGYIVVMVLMNLFPWNVFYKNIEYDAAAENYLRIKNNFYTDTRSSDWTVIGPDTQLAQVVGLGWHKDIYRFVREFSQEQVQSPDFIFPIPTQNIFVFIEKKPLFYGEFINISEAKKDLNPEGEDIFMQYFMEGKQRAIMEAKAWALVDAYKRNHEGVSIFYEDAEMIVYKIYQDKI